MSEWVNGGVYEFIATEKVIYGIGSMSRLADELERLGKKRAFVITSKTLARSEALNRLKEVLGDRCVGVFSQTQQHVPSRSVWMAAEAAREVEPDVIVSLGGGTPIDTGKAVCLVLAENIPSREAIREYRVKFTYPDKLEVPSMSNEAIPNIAIPTTLSAAEYDGIFGMTDEESRVKDLYMENTQLTPRIVILDPEVTRETPAWLWGATGIRAVDHAVETYLARVQTPVTDAMSREALRLLFANLPKSHRDPGNLESRLSCQIAAWLSMFGVANVTLGLSHGIGHQIGARCDVPHGYTSCIMLPVVLEYILPQTESRQAELALAAGLVPPGTDQKSAAAALAPGIRKLVADLGLPGRLRDVNVSRQDFPALAADAMRDFVVAFSPATVNHEQIIQLLENAY